MKLSERFLLLTHVFWKDYAYIIGLYSIAIGYPYLDILGNKIFFFTEHNASIVTIVITLFVLLLLIPVLLICIIAGIRKIFCRAAIAIDYGYVIIMSLMASIYCSNSSLICEYIRIDWQDIVFGILCIITAAVMCLLFRWQQTRDIFRCAAALPIVFALLFLFALPSSSLFRRLGPANAGFISPIKNPVPIVFVIMDGFSLQALLNCNGKIDRQRFPNLAALADTACWYRNARTVAGQTYHVLPAMLTGTATHLKPKPASSSEYPRNFFTWLQRSYNNLNIQEFRPYVNLATESVNTHCFLAHKFIQDLISMPYYFFIFPFERNNLTAKDSMEWVASMFKYSPDVDKWLEKIQTDTSLNFCHLTQPHFPLVNNYDGKFYANSHIPAGVDITLPRDVTSLINLSFHQYMLQCGHVDSIIGKIMAKLKQKNIFEKAMIIVAGDHGTSFYPGVLRRGGTSDIGLATTGFIPLIIKLPGQTVPVSSDRQATSIDILPTICGVLQAKPPWRMDGNDLMGKDFPTFDYDLNSKRIFYNLFVIKNESNYRSYSLDSVHKTFQKMLQIKNLIIADHLPMKNTAANYTAEEKYNPLLLHDSRTFTVNNLKETAILANISNGIFLIAEISAIPPALSGCPLAITLHGNIFIITRPERWREHPLLFGGMFPSADASPASIGFYVIENKQKHVILHKINNVKYQKTSLLNNLVSPTKLPWQNL